MPFASKSQERLFNSPNSPVGPSVVAKFDSESKGLHDLPEHVKKKRDQMVEAAALHHLMSGGFKPFGGSGGGHG